MFRVTTLALMLLSGGLAAAPGAPPSVGIVELDGSLNPGTADHLVRVIGEAEERGLDALLIRIDTPGGMVESTREVVKAMLAAEIPIITWVGPHGARAGSAGVFLTMAGHVAAMAPATNIGAAHPVAMGPGGAQEQDETMGAKVTNDLAAWARGIASLRGRNADWAEEAVRESVSVTGTEAVERDIVDFVAADVPAVLAKADGMQIHTPEGTRTLQTAGADLVELEPTARERILGALGDPNIAFLLLGLGFLGLLLELYSPGLIVPGTVGAILLALGLVATRMIPLNAGALVLLAVGAGLIVAELFVGSMGLLAVVGGICVAFGAFLLIDPSDPGFLVDRTFGLSWQAVVPTLVVAGGGAMLVIWKIGEARRRPAVTGADGLLGEHGVALTEIGPDEGRVLVHGELWEGRAREPIHEGQAVRIVSIDGLTLSVRPEQRVT